MRLVREYGVAIFYHSDLDSRSELENEHTIFCYKMERAKGISGSPEEKIEGYYDEVYDDLPSMHFSVSSDASIEY